MEQEKKVHGNLGRRKVGSLGVVLSFRCTAEERDIARLNADEAGTDHNLWLRQRIVTK